MGSFSCSLKKNSLKYKNLQPSHLIYLCASGLHVEVISISGVLPHPVSCYGNSSKHLQSCTTRVSWKERLCTREQTLILKQTDTDLNIYSYFKIFTCL